MVDWLTAYLPRDSAIQVNLIALASRSIHLMVRIQDSQSWHRGSIPLSTTTQELPFSRELFLFPKTKSRMMFPEVHNSAQLTELISSIGFLPLLDSGIPGFFAHMQT